MNAEDENKVVDDDDGDDESDSDEEFICEEDDDEESDDDDNPSEEEFVPNFLQGELIMDDTTSSISYRSNRFCLICDQPSKFEIDRPILNCPITFQGWIQNPNISMKFNIVFSKKPIRSLDPLELNLLLEQEKESSETNTENRKCCYDDNDVGKSDSKLSSAKEPSSKLQMMQEVFVVNGTQIGENSIGENNERKITFQGAYRCPQICVQKLRLICSVQTNYGGAVAQAMASGAPAAINTASASRKRDRSHLDNYESNGGNGVAYQELINLYDDSRLSTEALKRKYLENYDMEGDDITSNSKTNYKNISNDDEESDEGDTYGF